MSKVREVSNENYKNSFAEESPDVLILSDSKLPPFDLVLRCYLNHYLKKLNHHMLPRSRWKYLVMVVEFLHFLIGTGAFTLGLLFPPNWLPYNIVLVTIVLIGWEVLGYCFITKFCAYITNDSKCKNEAIDGSITDKKEVRFFIPFSRTILKLYGMLIIVLSIFFYLKPHLAPFNIVVSVLGYLLSWGWYILGFIINTNGVAAFIKKIIE